MSDENDPTDALLRDHADIGLRTHEQRAMVNAVDARLDRQRTVQRRTAPRRRWVLPGVAAITLVTVSGAAAAATGLWNPSLGDQQRGHPTSSQSAVPADQLALLSVLRRPADAIDRDATTRAALRYLDDRFTGVRTDDIRAAHDTPDAKRYLIVPVERSDAGVSDALCLYAVQSDGGGLSCWSTQQIQDGQAVLNALPAASTTTPRSATDLQSLRPSTARATAIGIVPDGVTTVTAAGGKSATVHDNVFVLNTTTPGDHSITWLDNNGTTIPQK